MSFAVFNPSTSRVRTFVTEAIGALPEGYEFRAEAELPNGWAMEVPVVDQLPVPEEVTLRQFLMAADRSGLLATLEALKTSEAIPAQTRRDIHFFLEYSNFIERNHPLILQLAPVVGVTSEQIDELFRAASAL